MAGSNYNLEITGDNNKFKRVVSDSMKQLDDLSKKTGGAFASISGQMGNMSGLLSSIKGLPAPLMAVGAAASAASLAFDAFNKSRDQVADLNKLSTATGLTVEELQKITNAFKATGIEMEQFTAINQDTLDKLADGVKDGSGIVQDLKDYGIEVQQYSEFINQANGGLKAVIRTFYEMQAAGKSQAEMINMMEAMGSDASKLIPILKNLGSEQLALQHINGQSVTVTNEMAESYKAYETALSKMSTEVDALRNDAMVPFVEIMTDILEDGGKVIQIINSIRTDDSQENIKRLTKEFGALAEAIKFVADTWDMLTGLEHWLDDAKNKSQSWIADGLASASNNAFGTNFKTDSMIKSNAQISARDYDISGPTPQGDWKPAAPKAPDPNVNMYNKEDNDKAKKAKSAQDAAKKAAAEMAKQLAERKAMLAEINTINQSLYTQQASTFAAESQQAEANVAKLQELLSKGIITQQEFETKRKAIVDQSSFNLEQTLLGTTDGDLSTILAGINQVYTDTNNNLKSQLEARLITQEQYNQKLELNEQMHTARMYEFQVAKDNSLQALRELGFTTDEENFQMEMEKMDEQFEKLQADNQARYDAQIISYEEFLASKARLEDVYAAKSTQLENDRMKSNLAVGESLATSMQGIFAGAFGEQSKAAKAAFVVSKSLAIAQSTMDAHSAATKALATYPQPMGGIMAGAAYAQVLAQVASIKSTNLTGMAHDGIDTVPEEGTWLLQKGERVVDNRTNQDLKDFLRDGSGSGGNPIEINAPLNISGNVDSSDRMVMDAINRYPEEVARMVEKAQSKRM